MLHIVFTLALEELGAGTVVLHDMDIPQDWNLSAVFTDRESVKSERPMQRVHVNWLHGDGGDLPPRHIAGRSPDDICRIVLTSGSTGKPKAVVFTHRTVERRLAVLEFAFGGAFARHTRVLHGASHQHRLSLLHPRSRPWGNVLFSRFDIGKPR